jgi:hypothetical protein
MLRLFDRDVAVPGTTLAGLTGLSERSARRRGDIGSPPPPRRLHDREVFRRPACRTVRRPSGGSHRLRLPLRVLAKAPSPVLHGPDRPSWGFTPLQRLERRDRYARPPGQTPSVLGVSRPLDGLISLAPCGHARSAAAHGVFARKALSDGQAVASRRIAAPSRPLRPFILGALQPRTLRNTRSKAPRTPRRLSPFRPGSTAVVPEPPNPLRSASPPSRRGCFRIRWSPRALEPSASRQALSRTP